MTILNMIWPALYVADEVYKFWYMVIVTILIEMYLLKLVLKISFSKALLLSTLGNIVSGVIGTFIMTWSMVFWHMTVDGIFKIPTFNMFNWVMTFILLFAGSVWLEVKTIAYWFDYKFNLVFRSMFLGNALTYIMIALVMYTGQKKYESNVAVSEVIQFQSSKTHFTLLDSTWMEIKNSELEVGRLKNSETNSMNYSFKVKYETEHPEAFNFQFRLLGNKYSGGMSDGEKSFNLAQYSDTIRILLEQKHPDPNLGWTVPVITDTIVFIRQSGASKSEVDNNQELAELEYSIRLEDSVIRYGQDVKLNIQISNPARKYQLILFSRPPENRLSPWGTRVLIKRLNDAEPFDYINLNEQNSKVYTDDELQDQYDTIKSGRTIEKQFVLSNMISINSGKKYLPKGLYQIQLEIHGNLTNKLILRVN